MPACGAAVGIWFLRMMRHFLMTSRVGPSGAKAATALSSVHQPEKGFNIFFFSLAAQ